MRKLFYVIVIAIVMVFALTFVYNNQEMVTVDYYGETWGFTKTLPLSLLLIGTLISGLVLGYLFSVVSNLRLRGRLMTSNRKLKKAEVSRDIV